jgi:DNA polymerase-3 subunit delta
LSGLRGVQGGFPADGLADGLIGFWPQFIQGLPVEWSPILRQFFVRLNPSQLTIHLSKSLAPIYIVAGEEPLLIQESLDAIRAKARTEGYSEREVLDADKNFNWQRLLDAGASLSLFASRRMIELNLPSGAPGVEGSKVLQQMAKQPPPDVLFLLVCGAVDWKSRQGAWYSALETAGASLYFEPVKPEEMPAWITVRAKSAGLKLDDDAVRELAERTEGNLLAAQQDIAKLKLLFPDVTVSAEQLAQAVTDSARYEAFDLNDRILDGDHLGAVRSLNRLRDEGVDVLEILPALTWSLRQWVQVQAYFAQTGDAHRACEMARLRKNQQRRYATAVSRSRLPQLYGWLRRCAAIDIMAKSTHGKDQAWEELLTLTLAASGAALRKST